jgi:hypothetical protein
MKKKLEAEKAKKAPEKSSKKATSKKRKASSDEEEEEPKKKKKVEKSEKVEKKAAPAKKEAKPVKKERKARKMEAVEESIYGLLRMDKHNLVSAILIRWKYCMDAWPGELETPIPMGFIEGHIPGFFVGVSNSVLGKMQDVRPFINGKTPSMGSLLTIKTVDLRDILINGIKKQMSFLSNSIEDQKLSKTLERELEKATKLKVKKIERKYLDAAKLMQNV